MKIIVTHVRRSGAFAILAVVLVAASANAASWPQFRGADSRGVADDASLPVRWSESENVTWKTPIPGRGWSSPVVTGGKVFLTTVASDGETEAPKKGLYFGGNRLKVSENIHHWKVYALDLPTGKIVWEKEVHAGAPEAPIHLKNSYASETPVTDGERLYVYFGGVGVFCFDLDGKSLWEKRIAPRKMRFGWGTAASPVLHDGRIYIQNDNDEDAHLMALDSATGEEIWKVSREERSNWATPYVWENSLRKEIITLGTRAVRSYDMDGTLLWQLSGMSTITIATPYAEGDMLYFSSGYVGDRKHRPIYAVRPGASGDISLAEEETSNEFIAWSQPMAAPYNPSTLLYRDRLYVLYDRGQMSCFDAKTGTTIYEKERLPKGAGFSASPWASDGKIYCLNEDGTTFVLKAGDSFELVATNSLGEGDMGMATPAIAGDTLLLRTGAALYALRG
jgi:outer membrane protein assembly factor BamB